MGKGGKKPSLNNEWEKEYHLLQRRAKTWEKTHLAYFSDYPKKPKRITKQSVEQLRQIKWSNFSEEDKRIYQQEYQEKYEDNKIDDTITYDEYTPPTEKDFYDDNTPIKQDAWEDTPNEPQSIREEFDAWIDALIDTILDISSIDRPNLEVRSTLENLIQSARDRMGDKKFYEFLSDGDRVSRLQQSAYNAMSTSPTKFNTGQNYNDSVMQFATELNDNRPLSDEDAFNIQAYGTMDFDYDEDDL